MRKRSDANAWHLRQWTSQACGHTLNHRQIFSPSGRAAYFDARNADPEIMTTDRVGRIDLGTGVIDWVYEVPSPNPFGPGVGAVVCHPQRDQLVFIHGLRNCDAVKPYSATRRFGAMLDARDASRSLQPAEARCLVADPPSGALRGGTHAHSWSADGSAISFTYNDAWIEERHRQGLGPSDLRTVGVMRTGRPVEAPWQDSENFSGACHAMIVAAVSHSPQPGTDTIVSAREECYLGSGQDAIAFLGRVRTAAGDPIDEVFVARWPEPLAFSTSSNSRDRDGRLHPPDFVRVERVTRSEDRKYPGVRGPRAWLVSSPDGRSVFCPMRDEEDVVQVASVDIASGRFELLTRLAASLESPLALDSRGARISLMSEGRVGIFDIATREIQWGPDLRESLEIRWGAFHFLPCENGLLFHAAPKNRHPRWQQLWTLTLH
ncbi:MAG: DUF3748 domain-containing protein [Planctomycetota bacterium]